MNTVILLMTALTMWSGEKRYVFGEVDSDLVTRRGVITNDNGYFDKVVWAWRTGGPEGTAPSADAVSLGGGGGFSPARSTSGPQVCEVVATTPGVHGEVTVLPRRMPSLRDSRYFLDLWQHPWAVARVKDVAPFSKAHYAAMKPLWEMLADAGQKCLTVTLLRLPWNHQCYDGYDTMIGVTKKPDGTWAYDFTRFDEYVAFGKACGIGPWISCYTMCPWGFKHYYKLGGADATKVASPRQRSESGGEVSEILKPGTAAYEAFWRPYLKALAKHLKAKGWLEHTFIAMDEREPEDMKAIVKLVKEAAPELKVSTAGDRAASAFDGIALDNYSQAYQHIDDKFRKALPGRHAKGQITTHYVCCFPPKPNTFIASPKEEAYALGYYPAESGLDGFLRWAYNSWPKDPDHDARFGNWPAGDTFLVYPDGSPSVRFLALRNGITDCVKYWCAGGREVPPGGSTTLAPARDLDEVNR